MAPVCALLPSVSESARNNARTAIINAIFLFVCEMCSICSACSRASDMIVPQQATLEPRGLGAKRISEAPDMRKRVTSAIILCGYPPGCALAALLLQHAPGQEQTVRTLPADLHSRQCAA